MTTNLIPMAGNGKRFAEIGYKISKPLIQVSGEPMILQAIKTFPTADKWIFVCKSEHINKDKIDSAIKKIIPEAKFLPIDYVTEGQACTCLLAKDLINANEPLFIGSCDCAMVWNKEEYEKLINEKDTDIICFVFTKQNSLAMKPKSYGWVKVKEDNVTIDSVSVKVPISDNPYNDYAVTAFFYFKTAKLFFEIAESLVRENIRINKEFYVDSCINQGIKLGYKAKIFVIDQFIGWGTPEELREYEFWERYFSSKSRLS